MDRPISSGQLTRNLWDNLLALGRMSGLVFVTSSRRKLQELIRDAQSVTSEFWLLFEPVRIGGLDEEDLAKFAERLGGHTFHAGALKEIKNWTGGHATLAAWLFNQLETGDQAVTNQLVNEAGATPDEYCTGILEDLWREGSASSQDLYRHLAEANGLDARQVPSKSRQELTDLGFILTANSQCKSACRLLENHVRGADEGFGAIGRMFGTWEAYSANIRGILERRIAQIERVDNDLFHMVERAIEGIPGHPHTSLNSLSHIEDKALEIVWSRELDADGKLSVITMGYWTTYPRSNRFPIPEMMEADTWELPGDRSRQLTLLQFLTGSHQDFSKSTAIRASKDTYVLLNALHSFRNRTQHTGGQVVTLGVAVSALLVCIELLNCLAQDAST